MLRTSFIPLQFKIRIREILLVVMACISASALFGKDIYVATNGIDAGNVTGCRQQPFRTFSNAVTRLSAGDTLLINGGTYHEQLFLSCSGTTNSVIRILPLDDSPVVIDMNGQSGSGVLITGSCIWLEGMEVCNCALMGIQIHGDHVTCIDTVVHNTQTHGIYTDGEYTRIENNEVFMTNLENEQRSWSSGWGSGIKVRIGGNHSLIQNNRVYHNYGEGIAVTRGIYSTVRNNHVFDNYAVQIYIDNSLHVLVEGNLCTCSFPSGFEYTNGSLPNGLSIAEEYYSGWGAQLEDITIQNNIAAFCERNMTYFGSDISGAGGLKNVAIKNNTFWGSSNTAVSIAYEPFKATNSVIANNIIQQPAGKAAWIENRTGLDMHHNFWVGNEPDEWRNCSGANDLWGDIEMMAPPGTNAFSFRLSHTSMAINSADPFTSPFYDYEGKLRSSSSSPATDRGALEYGIPDDSIPDAWETRFASTNLNVLSDSGNYDGDGLNDLQEYILDTNPLINNTPPLLTIQNPDGQLTVAWNHFSTNRWYIIETTTNLIQNEFHPVRKLKGIDSFVDSTFGTTDATYYRLTITTE